MYRIYYGILGYVSRLLIAFVIPKMVKGTCGFISVGLSVSLYLVPAAHVHVYQFSAIFVLIKTQHSSI